MQSRKGGRRRDATGTVVDQLTVISNLELKNAYPGTHATSNASFLSAAKAKWTESTDYHLGTTVDQVAAKQIGHQTRLRRAASISLERCGDFHFSA